MHDQCSGPIRFLRCQGVCGGVLSYRLRLPAFVPAGVRDVESIHHHIESWLRLYEGPEGLQLLKGQTNGLVEGWKLQL